MYLLLHSYTDAAPFRHRSVVAVVAGLAPAGPSYTTTACTTDGALGKL